MINRLKDLFNKCLDSIDNITNKIFQHAKRPNPDPTIPPIIPQTVTHFAKITLEFDPCTAVTPGICSAQASSSYPVMTSLLSPGQYTGYLHYLITLNSLNASTANFTITDTTVFTSIQNKLNAITAQIMALHN